MAFSIHLTQAAKIDMAEAMEFIMSRAPERAQTWLDGLFETIESLSEMPARHVLIKESAYLNRPLRGLFYYSHRIVYEINDSSETVSIIRIYHFARAPLSAEDLQ